MRRLIGALWAGSISAAICYAEYVGLGAMLGSALLGYGDQSQAMGTLLVVLAACLSCLVLCLKRLPVIAGPRGASMSIVVLGLISLQSSIPVSGADQLLVLCTMMLGCTVMLFIATLPWVQWGFENLPRWLIPSFIYASALSIIASAGNKYLYNCLLVHEWQTWGIFLCGTLAGLLWIKLFQVIAGTKKHLKLAALARSLVGTSLVVGAGTAWLLYELSSLQYASAGMCARLGVLELNVEAFTQRLRLLTQHDWQQIPVLSLLQATGWGLFVGVVVAIENRTAVNAMAQRLSTELKKSAEADIYQPLMRWNANFQALLVPATTIASSLSQSRTQMIWSLYRPSALAVLVHAVALVAIALFASHWLAWLPHIALVVLMTLVACSMVVTSIEQTWQEAYSLQKPGIAGGLGLWTVLAITALTGQALIGLVIPAAWFICAHWLKRPPQPKPPKTG